MRRISQYVLAWAVTTALAVAVSWFGIAGALDRALGTYDAPAPDGPAGFQVVRLAEATAAPTHPAPSPPPTSRPPAPATTAPRPTAAPSRTAARPTPTPSRPAHTPAPGTGTAYRVDADGGTAWISYAPADVRVIDTDPAPGYTVTVEQRKPDWVIVTFGAPRARSTISAYWSNGAYFEVTDEGT